MLRKLWILQFGMGAQRLMANRFKGSYRHMAKGRNRGVARMMRIHKSLEADERNTHTHPEARRSFARQLGYNRNSDRIRNGLHFI